VGRVRRTGLRRRADGVTVIVAPGVDGPPRVAFVAGRSLGSAVRRNRARRRLREAMARVRLRPGYDYVVLASPVVVEIGFDDLTERLRRAVEGS
jgi:ribonuclease P protein component